MDCKGLWTSPKLTLAMKDIIVVKIGSSTLLANTDRISRGKIEDIARQILSLRNEFNIVLVSSGAVAAARHHVTDFKWGDQLSSKQALAAIGQPKLMQIYFEVFRDYNLPIAQCLLAYRDFSTKTASNNVFNTILELLRQGVVPIINENETVAVDELVFGDNDKLSAKVAALLDARLLIMASDVDGLYDGNPHVSEDVTHIPIVKDLTLVATYVHDQHEGPGSGGMASKLEAARICLTHGIEVIITNGFKSNFISDCLSGNAKFTRFLSPG